MPLSAAVEAGRSPVRRTGRPPVATGRERARRGEDRL